jgi:hypothetical protein
VCVHALHARYMHTHTVALCVRACLCAGVPQCMRARCGNRSAQLVSTPLRRRAFAAAPAMRTTGSVWARVAEYVCAWVFRSGGPPLPRRQRGRELCTRRPSAPVQSATRGTARTCLAANRVQGTPMCACRSARLKQIAEARAHWVGSAYRSSRLGLALRFLRRLHGGACDRQEVSAKASEQPHTSPNGRRGLDDGPIGCGAPGVPCRAGVFEAGVLLGPCSSSMHVCR